MTGPALTNARQPRPRRPRRTRAFHLVADTIDQMIWSTRPDGFHDYLNKRCYDFNGVPDGLTDGAAWNVMFHPDDRECASEAWRSSLATGEPCEIEYRLRHRSGEYRWVLGRAIPSAVPGAPFCAGTAPAPASAACPSCSTARWARRPRWRQC